MKKTIIALMALAGVAMADSVAWSSADLKLNDGKGTRLGGVYNGGTVTDAAITGASDWATLNTQFANAGTWYVTKGYNYNVGNNVTAKDDAVVYVAGGPANNTYTAAAGMKFNIEDTVLENLTGPLTLSFDIYRHAGNNGKNHDITFTLLSADARVTSRTYNSKEGDNLLSTDDQAPTSVSLVLTETQVEALKTADNASLIFLASSSNVTGSNTGIAMTNFKLSGAVIPEPTTATLSLLALAGLAARRRRH